MVDTHNWNDPFIQKLTEITEANLTDEQFGVTELAREMGISRTVLYRKVKLKTKKSVSKFISEIRLKKAVQLLQENSGNVSEVANQVGFGSTTYFIKCFHDFYGFPPGKVLKNETKFNESLTAKNKNTKALILNKRVVYSSLIMLFITVFVLSYFTFQNTFNKDIEKSIAVLPFINDTPSDSNVICEGLREEIINKLHLIGEIKVISRTTSDTYRNSNKPIKTIGKELNVNYVLEGSAQSINGKTRIRLQLIEAKTDDHLWSNPFEREVNDENIFEIQQEIAELVGKKLKANITAKEKEVISKQDTENKTAYSNFRQGMNYFNIYMKEKQYGPLIKAKSFFLKAIKCDTTYSKAIYQLSWVLFQESKFGDTRLKRDSAVLLINKAIQLNPLFSEAYSFKGFLCQANTKEATKAFNMAIRTGPDKPEGYHHFGNFCCNIGEYANTIKYSLRALEVNDDPLDHDWTLINLNVALACNQFFDLAEKYRNEYMVQHNNQLTYYNMQQFENTMKRKYSESNKYGLLAYQTDSTDLTTLDYLAQNYFFLRDYKKALFYYKKYFLILKKQPSQIDFPTDYDFLIRNNRHSNGLGHEIFPLLNTMYLYDVTCDKKNYNTYKKALLDNLEKHIEYKSMWCDSKICYYEFGCIYASLNENVKAIEYLKQLAKGKVNPVWLVNYLNDNPMLDGLRNNKEFKNILEKLEINYQKEHKKAERILIENGFEPG